jgi:hypothetical protein
MQEKKGNKFFSHVLIDIELEFGVVMVVADGV